jgi:hypothetical protein
MMLARGWLLLGAIRFEFRFRTILDRETCSSTSLLLLLLYILHTDLRAMDYQEDHAVYEGTGRS